VREKDGRRILTRDGDRALHTGVGAMVADGCAASRHQDWPCTLALSGIRSFVPAILASI